MLQMQKFKWVVTSHPPPCDICDIFEICYICDMFYIFYIFDICDWTHPPLWPWVRCRTSSRQLHWINLEKIFDLICLRILILILILFKRIKIYFMTQKNKGKLNWINLEKNRFDKNLIKQSY